MNSIPLDSELLEYMVKQGFQPGDRLPTISELQQPEHLGVSISKVREQLEVARALGLVEVRSKTGMRMKEYSFTPAVHLSLFFALALDSHYFEHFSELRNHIEVAFWNEACHRLTENDRQEMRVLVERARAKLSGDHIIIPTEEHRAFHLTVFKRLDNPFVMGILESYWDAYSAVELNRYADYSYHREVWDYHERILEALCRGEIEEAKQAFIAHTQLIRHQPRMQDIERGSAAAHHEMKKA
ncbi:FadR family transcriptional regulator [Anaerolineae bacterium CFX9]|jgi:DNA-binding FadR family transcriptional regulator|nr:FCD domain-containing protein [Kamptonema cortianum]MDL1899714.1 FadR family transcriptional regulator [Anaerolineae bacterium CFX9]